MFTEAFGNFFYCHTLVCNMLYSVSDRNVEIESCGCVEHNNAVLHTEGFSTEQNQLILPPLIANDD